jgi:hypothetical protein
VTIVKKTNMRERGSFAPFNACCKKKMKKEEGAKLSSVVAMKKTYTKDGGNKAAPWWLQ